MLKTRTFKTQHEIGRGNASSRVSETSTHDFFMAGKMQASRF
jgi:hypothetical protein